MRFYTFINCYLSQIQQGIQTAHLLGEMVTKVDTLEQDQALDDFLANHKTIIVLNGGNAASIMELRDFFEDERNPFQFVDFYEDDQSLSGALTGIGILLPDWIYEARWNDGLFAWEYPGTGPEDGMKAGATYETDTFEAMLLDRITRFKLA